ASRHTRPRTSMMPSAPQKRCRSRLVWNARPTSATSPLSLHAALPILPPIMPVAQPVKSLSGAGFRLLQHSEPWQPPSRVRDGVRSEEQRLNSSHVKISYAVFCLKKKKRDYLAAIGPLDLTHSLGERRR